MLGIVLERSCYRRGLDRPLQPWYPHEAVTDIDRAQRVAALGGGNHRRRVETKSTHPHQSLIKSDVHPPQQDERVRRQGVPDLEPPSGG
jgi:hypothetical protein